MVFVTVCTHRRRPWLDHPRVHHLCHVVWARHAASWRVGQYVLMPDHLHLFCSPATEHAPGSLEAWISYWKGLVTRAASRPTDACRFQSQHWDTRLRSPAAYGAKRDYVRQNPVRAGLVSDAERWPFRGVVCRLDWDGQTDGNGQADRGGDDDDAG